MRDEVALQPLDPQLGGALGEDVVFKDRLPERSLGPLGRIMNTGWRVPMRASDGITAGQKGRVGGEMDADVLARVGSVIDFTPPVVERAAVGPSRDLSGIDLDAAKKACWLAVYSG